MNVVPDRIRGEVVLAVNPVVPLAENGWLQHAGPAPEQTIRQFLDEHGGHTDASVGHLLTSFGIAEGDQAGRDRIRDALAGVGVGIDRPLTYLGSGEQVRLFVASAPPGVVRTTPYADAGDVAAAPTQRMKRPVTLAALLLSLLISALLFAGLAAVAVLAINDPGPQGRQGVAGIQGVQGVKGKTGTRGKPGKTGKSGINGANGANGAPGATRACSNDYDVPLPFC
jgi:hypothetical protein